MRIARLSIAWGVLLTLLIACRSVPVAVHHSSFIAIGGALGAGVAPDDMTVEPEDGVRALVRAIDRAQRLIFVEAYILTDARVVHALERAAAQGVEVDVLLEPHPLGMGTQPGRMADMLRAAGVAVRWTRPDVLLTHAKIMVLDDRVVVISTANFSRSAFSRNREILVFLRGRDEVREVSNVFRADWDRLLPALRDGNVLVAPNNARPRLTELLRKARRSIDMYAEEVADPDLEHLLIAAARRGVRVRTVLAWGATPSGAQTLLRGGVWLRELRSPYVHAKMMLVDGREGYVGSENVSAASLDRNREVGVLLKGGAVRRLSRVFMSDWTRAQRPHT